MRTLNLVNPNNSNIGFKIINFSDTQTILEIIDPKSLYYEEEVNIKSRMSWNDIQQILQAVSILKDLKVQKISLYVPYLLGGRSDRKFSPGQASYLKRVIAPMLNALDIDIQTCDPHSIFSNGVIDKLLVENNINNMALNCRYRLNNPSLAWLVCPDEGANKRVDEVGKYIGNYNIVRSIKEREISTGKILGINVLSEDLKGRECMIVDDLCDGGRTFEVLAEELKKKNAGDLHLIVGHGIFSKGFDTLSKLYKTISTTNSVKDFDSSSNLIVFDVFQ